MLSRASSDAANRVRRSKSTSSVSRPVTAPEPFDPTIAQQHAVAAAQSAFVKSQAVGGTSRYSVPRPEVIRTRSNASRKSLGSQGSHFPPRESSFKTLQPRAAGSGQVSRHTRSSAQVLGKVPPFQNTLVDEHLQAAQPVINVSSFDENERPGSQPKSYRAGYPASASTQQIRKTRSMFYASTVQTGSPLPRSHANVNNAYLAASPYGDAAPDVALRSGRLSAPLPTPLPSPRLPITLGPNETREQARDKVLKGFQQRQVQKKPSILLAPFRKRQAKGKERVPRQLSPVRGIATDTQYTQADSALKIDEDCKLQKDKRSFSSSKWHKLMNVFRKTSDPSSPTLPIQQIDASRDYFNNPANIAPQVSIKNRSFDIPSPTELLSQRLRSRTPSSDHERRLATRSPPRPGSRGSGRSYQRNRRSPPRPGSRGSARSIQSHASVARSDGSRSSSWTSSTLRGRMKDRIRKRLSTVPENKHSVSSMAGQPIVLSRSTEGHAPVSPLASFQQPMSRSLLDVSGGVDPKRVFSALQKEIAAGGAESFQNPAFDPIPEFDADVFGSRLRSRTLPSDSLHQAIPPIPGIETHHERIADHGNIVTNKSLGNILGHSLPFVHDVVQGAVPSSIPERVDNFGLSRVASIRGEINGSAVDRASSIRGPVRIPPPDSAASPGLDSPTDARSGTSHTVNFAMSQENPLRLTSGLKDIVAPAPDVLASRKEKAENKWKGMLKPPHQPSETSAATALQNKGKSKLGKIARRAFSNRALKEHAISGSSASTSHPSESSATEMISSTDAYTHLRTAPEPSQLSELRSLPPRQMQGLVSAKIAEDSPYTIKRQQSRWPQSPSVYSRNTDGDSFLQSELSFDGISEAEEEDSEAGTILVTSPTFQALSYPLSTTSVAVDDCKQTRLSNETRNFSRDELPILHTDTRSSLPPSDNQARHFREPTQIRAEDEEKEHVLLVSEQLEAAGEALATSSLHHAPSTDQAGASELDIGWAGLQLAHNQPNQSSNSVATNATRKVSRRPQTKTTSSHGSSGSRKTTDSRGSSFMNDRYPMIDTGRVSKRNSGAYSRKSQSLPSSSESSSRKTTPSSRVYSDFSGMPISKSSGIIFSKSGEKPGQPTKRGRTMHANLLLGNYTRKSSEDGLVKENKAPKIEGADRNIQCTQATAAVEALADTSKGHGETLEPLKNVPSSYCGPALAPYTASNSYGPLPLRSAIGTRPMSKLPLATKSALELRNSRTPTSASLPLKLSVSESPKKRQRQDTIYHVESPTRFGRTSIQTPQNKSLGADGFNMVQESRYIAPSYTGGQHTSRLPAGLVVKRPLHAKTSSKVLALSKEPSPGHEQLTIESRLSQSSPQRAIDKDTPTRGGSMTPNYVTPLTHSESSRVTGRNTPGHRMAESFVRQREAGSGVSSPANTSPVNYAFDFGFTDNHESAATGDRSDNNDSPAFL